VTQEDPVATVAYYWSEKAREALESARSELDAGVGSRVGA